MFRNLMKRIARIKKSIEEWQPISEEDLKKYEEQYPTLEEFKSKAVGKQFGANEYTYDPETTVYAYVRLTKRSFPGFKYDEEIYFEPLEKILQSLSNKVLRANEIFNFVLRTFDVANVQVLGEREKGNFSKWLDKVMKLFPDESIYVESVQNPDLASSLKRKGWLIVSGGMGVTNFLHFRLQSIVSEKTFGEWS